MCTPPRGGCGARWFQPFLGLKSSLLLGAQSSQVCSHMGNPFSGPLPTCAQGTVENCAAIQGTQKEALHSGGGRALWGQGKLQASSFSEKSLQMHPQL